MSLQDTSGTSIPVGDSAQSYLQLATSACNGDDNAFGTLYERLFPQVFDFLARLVGNRELGEELTQESFVTAFEQRHRLRNPAAMRSWLFSIAYHRAMDYLRRSGRERHGLAEQAYGVTPEVAERNMVTMETAELVWSAAQSLEAGQYAILDLNLRQGLSGVDLARALGISPASASVRLHRAKAALGRAVQALLVARNPYHCDKLAALIPRLATSTPSSWPQPPYPQIPQRHPEKLAAHHGEQAPPISVTAQDNPGKPPEIQAYWPQSVKSPIVLSGTERGRVMNHLTNCDSCGRLAKSLTVPSALLGSFIMLTPNTRFDHFDLTSARTPEHHGIASRTSAGHIKSDKDVYIRGGGRLWSRALGIKELTIGSALAIIAISAGAAYILGNSPHTIHTAASRSASPVGSTNRPSYGRHSATSTPASTPTTTSASTPGTTPITTAVSGGTTPSAQTPDLYISTGAILGSLYSWPSFPSTIQLYNTGYLEDLSWVSANPQSASAHGIYYSCNYSLPGPCSAKMVSSHVELVASDPQYCTVKTWNQTTGQSSYVHAYIFSKLQTLNTPGSAQQPPFQLEGTYQACTSSP